MAIVGWLIVSAFGLFLFVIGGLLTVSGPSFNGKINLEFLVPVGIGSLLIWWSYTSAPFEVLLK